jgi:hypothetical protein
MVEKLIKGIPIFLFFISCSSNKNLSDLKTNSFGNGFNALIKFQSLTHEVNLKIFETTINITDNEYPNMSIEKCKISSVVVFFQKDVSFMEFFIDSFQYKNERITEIRERFIKGIWGEQEFNGTIVKSTADIEVDLFDGRTFKMNLDCEFNIINDSLILDKCQSGR